MEWKVQDRDADFELGGGNIFEVRHRKAALVYVAT